MAKLLVTGGAGFIGANFVRYWSNANPNEKIIVIDSLTYAGNIANLHGVNNVILEKVDIRDTDTVAHLLMQDVDTVVHFAAESHVDRSIHGPDAFIETNIIGTHSLLKAAKKVWLDGVEVKHHRFHHVSTDEVFGSLGPEDPAFCETTRYAPNSPYSATKAASDHLVRAYHHTYGLQVTISNCSNNYGPYQFPEKLIPLFLINALNGKPLPIYGDGMNVRDWLHVSDHCYGIDLILKHGRVGEVYNIGGGAEMPNIGIIDLICESVDRVFAADSSLAQRFPNAPAARGLRTDSLKTWIADRPGHDRRYAIDETKAREQLGYKPSQSFENHFNDTVAWYLDNTDWWAAILDGSYAQWIEKNYKDNI
jgi:dTDP-glucose 4,6-dehydratase